MFGGNVDGGKFCYFCYLVCSGICCIDYSFGFEIVIFGCDVLVIGNMFNVCNMLICMDFVVICVGYFGKDL